MSEEGRILLQPFASLDLGGGKECSFPIICNGSFTLMRVFSNTKAGVMQEAQMLQQVDLSEMT